MKTETWIKIVLVVLILTLTWLGIRNQDITIKKTHWQGQKMALDSVSNRLVALYARDCKVGHSKVDCQGRAELTEEMMTFLVSELGRIEKEYEQR